MHNSARARSDRSRHLLTTDAQARQRQQQSRSLRRSGVEFASMQFHTTTFKPFCDITKGADSHPDAATLQIISQLLFFFFCPPFPKRENFKTKAPAPGPAFHPGSCKRLLLTSLTCSRRERSHTTAAAAAAVRKRQTYSGVSA